MSATDHRLLTPEQIERVYQLTDTFFLHREFVVVPLMGDDRGMEMVLPDGKVLVRPCAGAGYESWYAGLAERVSKLNLNKTRRAATSW